MKYFICLLFFSLNTFAYGLYFEPYVGTSFYGKSGYALKEDSIGAILGAIVGLIRDRVFLAAGWNHLGYDRPDPDEPIRGNDYYLSVGANFPINFRAFIGAIIDGNYKAESVGNNKKAHGYIVGIGYRFWSYWTLNLELRQAKYEDYNSVQKAHFKAWNSSFTLSFPWEWEIVKSRKHVDL